MSWSLGLASYLVIWWVTLFAILPIGVRSQQEMGNVVEGSDPGAPHMPRLGRKAIITTIVALLVWLPLNWAYITYFLAE